MQIGKQAAGRALPKVSMPPLVSTMGRVDKGFNQAGVHSVARSRHGDITQTPIGGDYLKRVCISLRSQAFVP
jgi:hypothetical protein